MSHKIISLARRLSLLNSNPIDPSESKGEWQLTFDAMNAAVWIIDKDHFILRSNKTTEKLFNRKNDEIIGKRCWEIVHGTDAPIPQCPVLRVRKSLSRESMELFIGNRWFEVVVDPILDGDGNFVKAVHIVTDITDHKRTDERLKRSEALLSDAQELSKTGGWEWDVRQQKMYWTQALYHLHAFDPSKFEPGSADHISASLKCYAPEDRPVIMGAFERCARRGIAYDLEFPFTQSSGERIHIRTAAKPVWKDGQVEKVVGFLIDITDVKKVRDELIAQKERISKFFNSIDDAIFVHPFVEEGFARFSEVNDIACERYGYTREEFSGLSAKSITLESDISAHGKTEHRNKLLRAGRLVFETTHIKKSGETFPVEINSIIFHEKDNPLIVAVVRDITERKKDEEKREQLIGELQNALENIQKLQGLIPICSYCKKIRDDKGYWNQLEAYIEKHSDASFSHGMCPECSDKLYGDLDWYADMKKSKEKK
ncbi:MAG: PAS domain S-box protein [Desulfobacter sp.]|nr:MAG: PAS domain S-box protein [Desulfobacter sp.]